MAFAFFMILAWTEPDPPIPEYGIEMSLGNAFEPTPDPEESENESDQPQNEAVEQLEEQPTSESSSSETSSEEVEEQDQLEEAVSNELESPDNVESSSETTETTDAASSDVNTNTDQSDIDSEKNEKTNDAQVEEVEQPKVDDRAIFKKSDTKSGNPGAKGPSLDFSGWMWEFEPEPNDQSQENGKIVFQVTVDEDGILINVKTLEKTISPALEQVYKDAVRELTFRRTAENRSTAAQSTGKITFIIQTR